MTDREGDNVPQVEPTQDSTLDRAWQTIIEAFPETVIIDDVPPAGGDSETPA